MLLPKNLLPERWQADAFIAGGYAACRELATDIDVWVSVPDNISHEEVRKEILANLLDKGFRFVEAVERTLDENVELGYSLREGGIVFLDNRQVATVTGGPRDTPYAKPYHLVVTNGGVNDVLNGFDISTHQCAILPDTSFFKGDGWTPLNEEPVILKDTPHTQDRFVKIKSRYLGYRTMESVVPREESALNASDLL